MTAIPKYKSFLNYDAKRFHHSTILSFFVDLKHHLFSFSNILDVQTRHWSMSDDALDWE